jgi:RimJ/RimL family protein N-acetyltransferase
MQRGPRLMKINGPGVRDLHPSFACGGRTTMGPSPSACRPFEPTQLTLRDGRRVNVRTIRPDDKSGLRAAFQSLSADARYARFMAPKLDLSAQLLDVATHPDAEHDCALVAVQEPEGTIVGGARYAGEPGGERCEFAVTLVDAWQGLGLARRLMELLIERARSRGLKTMVGYVLSSNTSMRGLARRLGFRDAPCPDEPGVRVVTLDLQPG